MDQWKVIQVVMVSGVLTATGVEAIGKNPGHNPHAEQEVQSGPDQSNDLSQVEPGKLLVRLHGTIRASARALTAHPMLLT